MVLSIDSWRKTLFCILVKAGRYFDVDCFQCREEMSY
jgi:hypothetical protein